MKEKSIWKFDDLKAGMCVEMAGPYGKVSRYKVAKRLAPWWEEVALITITNYDNSCWFVTKSRFKKTGEFLAGFKLIGVSKCTPQENAIAEENRKSYNSISYCSETSNGAYMRLWFTKKQMKELEKERLALVEKEKKDA